MDSNAHGRRGHLARARRRDKREKVAIAAISGLGTMYIGKPTFGGLASYITLFLWGAAIDQTKNFAQHLGSVRGS